MHKNSRIFLTGALILLTLVAACGPREISTPIVVQTIPGIVTNSPQAPDNKTVLPTATLEMTPMVDSPGTLPETSVTPIPGIPITGGDTVELASQYCIGYMAHVLLVFPATDTFELVSSSPAGTTPGIESSCKIIDIYTGKQVVLCRAEEDSSISLNICTADNNCTQVPVTMQTCPGFDRPQPSPQPYVAPTKERDGVNPTPVPPTAAPPPSNPTVAPPAEPVNTPADNPTEPPIENPTEPPVENPTEPPPGNLTEPPPIIPPVISTVIP